MRKKQNTDIKIIDFSNLSLFETIKEVTKLSNKSDNEIYCKVASMNIQEIINDLPLRNKSIKFIQKKATIYEALVALP